MTGSDATRGPNRERIVSAGRRDDDDDDDDDDDTNERRANDAHDAMR
jgi:hypothetical protein